MDEHREEREELDAIQRDLWELDHDEREAQMDAFIADARRYEQVNDD